MTGVGAFLGLSGRRRRLLVLAFVLSTVARIGLAVSSYRRVATLFESVPGTANSAVTTADVRWAVVVSAARVPGAACLTRGVVGYTLCRRYGHESDLYVGVDRESDEFVAHSWVVSGDRVVVGDEVDLDRYEPLGVLE